jgi:hypothetical protein
MQYVLNAIHGRMFISESIAPLFPYQYAHSRRIACDAEASLIGNTEYTMNSVSYGWWLDGLYTFNDPDIMVFGNGADTNENQSRLISGAVTGIFLDGDDLTTTAGQAAAQSCLSRNSINAVAREGLTFLPVEANTGSSAADTFARQDGSDWLLAVFNYTANSTNKTVDFARAGIPPANYAVSNLWDGTGMTIASNSFTVNLNAKQAKLFRLAGRPITINYASTPDGSRFIFGGNGGIAGSNYVVLTSTNLATPPPNWTAISTNRFDASGAFQTTNPINPGVPQLFYRLKSQ